MNAEKKIVQFEAPKIDGRKSFSFQMSILKSRVNELMEENRQINERLNSQLTIFESQQKLRKDHDEILLMHEMKISEILSYLLDK